MKKFRQFVLCTLLVPAALMLSGCEKNEIPETTAETVQETTLPTEAAAKPVSEITDETLPERNLDESGYEVAFGSAKSMLLYNADNGTVICSRDPDARLAPGRLTQIVTALVAIENCSMEDSVTVGSMSGWNLPAGTFNKNLRPGEVLTVRDLVACVMLENAGDAAIVLAEHTAGSQEAFVDRMNERVKAMGCTDTEFADVHGLDAENSHTTARDLLRITIEAIQNETFRAFFGKTVYTVPATNQSGERELDHFNYMLHQRVIPEFYDPRVTGGMQTYHQDTGAGLICTVEDDGLYIGIVLGSERMFGDPAKDEPAWQCKHFGNYEEMAELLNQGIQK